MLRLNVDEEDMPDELLGRKITRRTPKPEPNILDDALKIADYVAKRKAEGASMKDVIQEIKEMKK